MAFLISTTISPHGEVQKMIAAYGKVLDATIKPGTSTGFISPPCEDNDPLYCYSGQLNESLLKLGFLSHLDLSGRNFFTTFPNYIGSLRNLRYLNLSLVSYPDNTVIPLEISNLSSLHTLDLSESFLSLPSSKLGWLLGAYSLRRLDLTNVDLSRATDWLETVAMLPSLSTLHMSYCNLHPPKLWPLLHVNISNSLKFLDLSSNDLGSSSIHWLPNITRNLNHLDFSSNNLSGSVPEFFLDISSLTYLDLSDNNFEGGIPKSLGRLCNLQTMDLSSNSLTGQLAAGLHNFSTGWCPKVKMAALKLNDNYFEGIVPQLGMLPNLKELHLNDNYLTGIAPDFSQSLEKLHLAENRFDSISSVMEIIGRLSNLTVLDISSNPFESVIVQAHFNNLTALKVLSISNIHLNLSFDWDPPFQLQYLRIASCNLGPHFPHWLQTQNNLAYLNLSQNGIKGDIPGWFWNIFNSSSFSALDLSRNHLSGTLSSFFLINQNPIFSEINLSSNNLTGPIPPNFLSVTMLDLSDNFLSGSLSVICTNLPVELLVLNLANNSLSGVLPNCWSRMKFLVILNLANNNLSGNIPETMGSMSYLKVLHLRKNKFSGKLPLSLRNLTNMLFLDIMGNNMSGNILVWIGESLPDLLVLSMRSNKLYGNIPPSICNMNNIKILDLSLNNLSGGIPHCFDNFTYISSESKLSSSNMDLILDSGDDVDILDTELVDLKGIEREYKNIFGLINLIDLSSNKLTGGIPKQLTHLVYLKSLNLSRNHLSGAIPSTIGSLSSLETLDLSTNQLSGEIPSGLSVLYQLGTLDLSCNNLSGRIPVGNQLQTLGPSSYQGNIGLCGPPLAACSKDRATQEPEEADFQQVRSKGDDQDDEDEFLSMPFFIGATLGFTLAFWSVFGSLAMKRSWRRAFFQRLNHIKDELYVKIVVGMARLQRRFQ